MVWETPNGLYSLFKQQGCSMSVCHDWQPSRRRANFRQTCVGCLLGMECTCTGSYFLCNANNLFSASELILFSIPFLMSNSNSAAPCYFNPNMVNAGWEPAAAAIPPWLKAEICAFMPPRVLPFPNKVTYPSLDQLSFRNWFLPGDLAISCPINSCSCFFMSYWLLKTRLWSFEKSFIQVCSSDFWKRAQFLHTL